MIIFCFDQIYIIINCIKLSYQLIDYPISFVDFFMKVLSLMFQSILIFKFILVEIMNHALIHGNYSLFFFIVFTSVLVHVGIVSLYLLRKGQFRLLGLSALFDTFDCMM